VPCALRSLLQLDQGDRYGNCEEGRSGQEGRSGEEGCPREEGGTGEEGCAREEGGREEGRAREEGGRKEGRSREEGGAGEEGGGEEGRTREEGGTGEEGGCREEAKREEAGSKDGGKEAGSCYARCANCFCAREDDAEPGRSLAIPDGQQALSVRTLAARAHSLISRARIEPGSCWALFVFAV